MAGRDWVHLGIRLTPSARRLVEAAAALSRQSISELTRVALERQCEAVIRQAREAPAGRRSESDEAAR